ncbi:MarR family winged helix-turn-helix transcriptional regulator [Paenibacillus sp. FJAT-26967]|uniref:MarR family winged helix-turn-helix transcriptional regulator n=1 Tax=Paenibacillus sp. FJAT-26967 TaxID=1729690 RepID=UPI000837F1C6|nr:MarR family transcriptional regulator [Paenibacillus sp. FJAT-26967]
MHPNHPDFKSALDDSIGFLLGITYRKISNLLTQRLKDYDITPEQWSVLYRIYEQDGLIQREIADRAGKDKPTTTRILDSLEAKGFIHKKAGQGDRRSFHVHITEKGQSLIRIAEPIEKKTVQDAVKHISQDEYDLLIKLLHQIGANIQELTE